MGWEIHWEGEAIREDDLTLAEIDQICDLANIPWVTLHPLRQPKHLRAIVAVLKAREGADARRTFDELGAMRGGDALAAIREADDDLPEVYENGLPKAGDGPETTGSSGAPSPSAGPPTSSDASDSGTSDS